MVDDVFYLVWSHEHGAWWGPGQRGYVRSLSAAGIYGRAEALEICTKALPGTAKRLGLMPDLPVLLADAAAAVDAYKAQFPERVEAWF